MTTPLIIKMVSTKPLYADARALRQFPGGEPRWGDARFVFDRRCGRYDWLVVYHNLPAEMGGAPLHCARANTVFVTHEPSGVKTYGRDFCAQFGHVLTCHEERTLPHANRIAMQPGSVWYYGGDGYGREAPGRYDYDALRAAPAPAKSKMLSTVCSDKKMRHTLHYRRYHFTRQLRRRLPEMDVFGHGVKFIRRKADALDDYSYHLAVENYRAPHYWTEKLSDAFLGFCMPFYYGCPNAADYFPPESFIPVDINDVEGSAEIMRRAMRDGAHEKNLPAVLEARRRVLEEHNLYAMLARVIKRLPPAAKPAADETLYSRYQLMRIKPLAAARYLFEKLNNRRRAYAENAGR